MLKEYFEVDLSLAPVETVMQPTAVSSMADKKKQELERIYQQQEAIARQETVAQAEQISDTNP